jgi:hypothetical protein
MEVRWRQVIGGIRMRLEKSALRYALGAPHAGSFRLLKTLHFNIANIYGVDSREQALERNGFLGDPPISPYTRCRGTRASKQNH